MTIQNGIIGLLLVAIVSIGLFISVDAPSFGAVPNNADFSSTATSGVMFTGPDARVAAHATGEVLAARSNRLYALITNLGASPVSLCLSNACSNTEAGRIILAASSTYAINQDNLYTGIVTVYSAATTTKVISILEARY